MIEFLACTDCGEPTGQALLPGRPRPVDPSCDDCREAYLSEYAPLCEFTPSEEELFPPEPWPPSPAEMMPAADFAVFEKSLAEALAADEDNDDDDECLQ